MSQANVETATRSNDAQKRGDWQALAKTMDAHVLLRTDPRWPEQHLYGREAVIAFVRDTGESGGTDMRIEEIVDLGDRLLIHRRWIRRGERSGVEGDVRYSEIATFRDGKVILIEMFLEREQALRAMGLEA